MANQPKKITMYEALAGFDWYSVKLILSIGCVYTLFASFLVWLLGANVGGVACVFLGIVATVFYSDFERVGFKKRPADSLVIEYDQWSNWLLPISMFTMVGVEVFVALIAIAIVFYLTSTPPVAPDDTIPWSVLLVVLVARFVAGYALGRANPIREVAYVFISSLLTNTLMLLLGIVLAFLVSPNEMSSFFEDFYWYTPGWVIFALVAVLGAKLGLVVTMRNVENSRSTNCGCQAPNNQNLRTASQWRVRCQINSGLSVSYQIGF